MADTSSYQSKPLARRLPSFCRLWKCGFQSVGKALDVVDKLWRFMHLEIDSEQREVNGDALQGMGTCSKHAGILIQCLEHAG